MGAATRRARAAALALVALMPLVAAGAVQAHLNVQPLLVEQGRPTDFRLELPRLRPGGAPVRLSVDGMGVRAGEARLRRRLDGETVWDVRATIDAGAGRTTLVLRAEFADGESVEVAQALTVLPADAAAGLPVTTIIVGVALALALGATGLLVVRPGRRQR